jgi:hypothetical protein
MAPSGQAQFPDITVKATAKAVSPATLAKVAFYDGKTLIDTAKTTTSTATITSPKSGKHSLRVDVTDSKGKLSSASCLVTYTASSSTYTLTQAQKFKGEGQVPQDWYVSNGSTKIVGGGLPKTSGNRLLRFTNSSKAFEYGLLVQNATTKAKSAWAKFGDKSGRSTLSLYAGKYALKYKLCNWNCSNFAPVTIAILNANGDEVATQTYTPTVNIGGDVSKKFTGVVQQTFEFDIPETGDYVVVFYADAAKNADFVLGQAIVQVKEFATTGIKALDSSAKSVSSSARKGCFDLSGRRIINGELSPGIYVIDGRKVVIRSDSK